ncbi:reverse transcriptase domain-containing protein [Tanacetum coccineum]
MAPKRKSTSAAALEAQAATMANADNTNRNTRSRETHVVRNLATRVFELPNFHFQRNNDHNLKFDDRRTFTNKKYKNNRNNNSNRNNDHQQQQNRRQETIRDYAATPTENNRNLQKNKGPAAGSNLQPVSVTCHACKEKGHYKQQCPKANNSAHGRAYLLRDKNVHQDPNVVTDHDSHFTSRFWQSHCRVCTVLKLDMRFMAYHPETMDKGKDTIQKLNDMLRAVFRYWKKGWVRYLPL